MTSDFDTMEGRRVKPNMDMPLVPLAVALTFGLVFWLAVGLGLWWAL